ncbi:MAG TPA: hypothetical protein VFH00_05885 [Candidatus Nitrosotalea sp.]|nr:hypothetical protein [Candidatus Nitrosotalea sp.]
MNATVSVPILLWRGELRAQGLLLRRRLFTLAQSLVFVAIYISVVVRARDALTQPGPVRTLNVAVLTLSLVTLMAANVTLLGERTGTLPWQLQRWAAALPLGIAQVARLIVGFSLLRSGLVTLTILAAAAVGALMAARSLASVVVIVVSLVLLPLLPVALGLQWARRRGTSVSIAFSIVPLGLLLTASSVPLPATSGWIDTVVGWAALPGMMLAGRTGVAQAAIFLAAWTGLALVLMRPAALSLKDNLVARGFGSSIWRLSRLPATPAPNQLALDIAVHRVSLTDLLEILLLGAVSCSVVALQTFPGSSSIERGVALAAAFSAAAATATIAGYIHMSGAVKTDPPTEAWIRTLPLPARALSVARHAVCTAGALLAILPVMVLVIVESGGPGNPGAYVLAAWTGMSFWALTGWFASVMATPGLLKKRLGGYAVLAGYSIRTLLGAAVLVLSHQPILVLILFAADFGVGLAGQWRGPTVASPEWGR